MKKTTRPPWTIIPNGQTYLILAEHAEEKRDTIVAEVYRAENARLISIAPKLLWEARAAIQAIELFYPNCPALGSVRAGFRSIIEQVHAD